jgi:hypothetical protein
MMRKSTTTGANLLRLLAGALAMYLRAGLGIAGPTDPWTHLQNFSGGETLLTVTFGNGIFVTAGDGGSIFTSADGTNWISYNALTNVSVYVLPDSIVFANSNFVAFGVAGGDGFVQTSSDAVNWSNATTFPGGRLFGVTYGNGVYVGVGQIGAAGLIATSTNGVNWSTEVLTNVGSFSSVAYGIGRFLAVGSSSTNTAVLHTTAVFTSDDGLVWTQSSLIPGFDSFGIAYGNGMFVVGAKGAFGWRTTLISADGANWRVVHPWMDIRGVIFGNAFFAATGFDGVATSIDGVSWSLDGGGGEHVSFGPVAYGAGRFLAVGTFGANIHSSDVGANCFMTGNADSGGAIRLTVTGGAVGLGYRIQAATDLLSTNWTELLSYTNSGATNFLDTGATNQPQRFYRVVSP